LLAELQSLAALASSQPDIIVRTGNGGCPWSFNWATRVITTNPDDLAQRPPDYCRGLILHESAHAAITRLSDIVPPEKNQGWLRHLLNVVEDCRIENWLLQRFPGSAPWIRLYNNHLLGHASADTATRVATDPAAAFLSGLLDRWWNPSPILKLHPTADAAIDGIWPYFQQAVAAFPPARAEVPSAIARAYQHHPVSLCYESADRQAPPTPKEREIRMRQHHFWSIVWQRLVPVFIELLQHPDSEPTWGDIQLADRRAQISDSADTNTIVNHSGLLFYHGDQEPNLSSGASKTYEQAVARNGQLIEDCAAILLRFLTGGFRHRRSRFHSSGQRIDLRIAMQCEADPRHYDRLWQRTQHHPQPDPAFVVAVDASGSMRGEKSAATFDALVVIREICLRIDIPLSIISFNRNTRILQAAGNPRDPEIPARLAGLLQPVGGTLLCPALMAAADILRQCSRKHRHLWVLSDGMTQQQDKARALLDTIRADGTRVHGLGLASKGIRMLIPDAAVRLRPNDLPGFFSRTLQNQITCLR
jgi:hypothetical protein